MADEGKIGLTVILDADPEVYRLGYGTETALDRLREAAARNLFDLRVQRGVRIGVVICDDVTNGPLSRSAYRSGIDINGEAQRDYPVWWVSGPAGECRRRWSRRESSIARNRQTAVDAWCHRGRQKGPERQPPQPFDVARALRVFTSRVQYVEIGIENYRLSSRRVELPQELLDITDDRLREQISGRLRPPTNLSGPFKIKVETSNGEKSFNVDEKWLSMERKRIDGYTFIVPNFGRVVLSTERQKFDNEIERFKRNLQAYHEAVVNRFEKVKSDLEKSLVREYLPRWRKRPPSSFRQYAIDATSENLERELRSVVQEVICKAVSFEKPRVRVVYKNVAPESVRDPNFS